MSFTNGLGSCQADQVDTIKLNHHKWNFKIFIVGFAGNEIQSPSLYGIKHISLLLLISSIYEEDVFPKLDQIMEWSNDPNLCLIKILSMLYTATHTDLSDIFNLSSFIPQNNKNSLIWLL